MLCRNLFSKLSLQTFPTNSSFKLDFDLFCHQWRHGKVFHTSKTTFKNSCQSQTSSRFSCGKLKLHFYCFFFIWFNSLKFLFISPRRPPAGSPAANSSFKPAEISDTIDFSRGLPGFLFVLFSLGPRFFVFYFSFSPIGWKCFFFSGTKYDFWLYYSNSTISDWLTWTGEQT